MPRAPYSLHGKRVWVAGHSGMVGSALVRRLESENCDVLTTPRSETDLTSQDSVRRWVAANRPDCVFVAAAKVGGIVANNEYPVDFLYKNLMIQANIAEAAFRNDVKKALFIGSSCIYPRLATQPIHETALLSGPLEPTNEWYAIAKIAGIKLAQAYRRQYRADFISAMPTNLYGPNDNFDLKTSHVLPALLRKAHDAVQAGMSDLVLWGTGTPRREFLHVDDCADALVFLMKNYSDDQHVNIGFGSDISIWDLARLIANVVGFGGRILLDDTKPDGTPRKLLDSSQLRDLGWVPKIELDTGLKMTNEWYLASRFSHVRV